MSLGHGSSIVRDGLVLHLDAANRKSYPGSGSTWFDLSSKKFNAAISNSPAHDGKSLSFDGVDDYATVDNGLKAVIEAATDFTIVTLATIKFIEHVDNLVGWGNANPDGTGYARTFGQYARNASLHTSYYGAILGSSDILNKPLLLVSRYQGRVYYADTYGSVRNSNVVDATNSTTNTWKGISTTYPITIAKTSYYTRWMQVDVSAIMMYDRFLSQSEIDKNFNAIRGRYGI